MKIWKGISKEARFWPLRNNIRCKEIVQLSEKN